MRLVACGLLLCAATHAQHVVGTSAEADGHSGIRFTVKFAAPVGTMGALIPNDPYSLRGIKQHVSAEGKSDPQQVVFLMARDSQGRRRLETFQLAGQYSPEGLRIVEIRDWVSRYEYTLDTVNHIAYRMKLPPATVRSQSAADVTPNVRPDPNKPQTIEVLTPQTIDGFFARGVRRTDLPQPGAAATGAFQEVWLSSDLEPAVRTVDRDSSGAQTIQSIDSVNHSEPAPDLFTVPANYEIRDVDGVYSIVLTVSESSVSADARRQIARSTQLASGAPVMPSFAVATGTFPVAAAAGKTIRFSGWIRTENVTAGYAGLWWRVDGSNREVLAFDNSMNRSIAGKWDQSLGPRGATGTTPWTRYEFQLPVPSGAVNINFGTLFTGKGTAWFDGLQVELNGVIYQNPSFDFDFESPKITGFGFAGDNLHSTRYKVALDSGDSHTGQQSLKMEFVGDAPLAARNGN